jgi:hypothetical protein
MSSAFSQDADPRLAGDLRKIPSGKVLGLAAGPDRPATAWGCGLGGTRIWRWPGPLTEGGREDRGSAAQRAATAG